MAVKSKPQIWVEYLLTATILSLFRVLPRRTAMWTGTTIGAAAYYLLSRLRRVGLRNLELAFPDKSVRDREKILRGVFRNLGRVMAVFSEFDDLTKDNLRQLIVFEPDPEFVHAYERSKQERRGR